MNALYYIGDEYYEKSGTMIGVLYDEDLKTRHDWGTVKQALQAGQVVVIRPATRAQLEKADAKLGAYVRSRRIYR